MWASAEGGPPEVTLETSMGSFTVEVTPALLLSSILRLLCLFCLTSCSIKFELSFTLSSSLLVELAFSFVQNRDLEKN